MRQHHQLPLWGALAIVYIGFLFCDLTGIGPPRLSSVLKYTGMLLCLLLVLTGRTHALSRRDRQATLTAFCLTLVADALLLFTTLYVAGVAVFCCAQLAWLARYRPALGRPVLVATGVVFAVCIALHFMGSGGAILYILCGLYAALILAVTASTFRSPLPRKARRPAQVGMVLFLLCDVNVVFYNLLPNGGLQHTAGLLMWLFYLPAQALLAASCVGGPFPSGRDGRR